MPIKPCDHVPAEIAQPHIQHGQRGCEDCLKTGDTWELVIPSDLAYGSDGKDNIIPPDQTLVFLLNLAKVEYGP